MHKDKPILLAQVEIRFVSSTFLMTQGPQMNMMYQIKIQLIKNLKYFEERCV